MKYKIVLHIPHSSLKLTKEFLSTKKLLTKEEIRKFNLQMADLYTDKLFKAFNCKQIKARYSRICCDVEKFSDDKKEGMSKYGLGVIYSKNIDGKDLIYIDENYRRKVLKKYYFPYHSKLNKKIITLLKKHNVILIDCHSFSKEIVKSVNLENIPDICIGHNENLYFNNKLLDFSINYFSKLGYKVTVNYPYSGSMVPNALMENEYKNFSSLMIEINRELYMERYKKSKNFNKIHKEIKIFLKYITKL